MKLSAVKDSGSLQSPQKRLRKKKPSTPSMMKLILPCMVLSPLLIRLKRLPVNPSACCTMPASGSKLSAAITSSSPVTYVLHWDSRSQRYWKGAKLPEWTVTPLRVQSSRQVSVSYTHLTLPTNREV